MSRLLTVVLLLFCIESIGQNSISEHLIKACNQNNTVLYEKALNEWSQNIQSWSEGTLLKNVLLQDINSILKLIYSKENYDLIENSIWGELLPTQPKEKYVLFNETRILLKYTTSSFCFDTLSSFREMRINLHDSLGKSEFYNEKKHDYFENLTEVHTDTLKNLRPQIQFSDKVVLYTTDSIYRDLNSYMYSKKGLKKKRDKFIYSNIYVIKPFIEYLIFDENRQNCFLKFRLEDRGGYTRFKKENNKWKIIESEILWIH